MNPDPTSLRRPLAGLKRTKPDIHVIIATGFGTVEVAVHAMQKGALDFMLKPVDLEALVHRIKNAVNSSPGCCRCRAHRPGAAGKEETS